MGPEPRTLNKEFTKKRKIAMKEFWYPEAIQPASKERGQKKGGVSWQR
jgi:hypothetical protein